MRLPTDPAENLAALLRCPSVTPRDEGVLDALAGLLRPLGFACIRDTFGGDDGTQPVDNLYASLRGEGPHLLFAGHTDVVPPGEPSAWKHPPFAAAIEDGEMYGRGAVDMKGGIAAFIAAVARQVERRGRLAGTVSLLITNDEEGPAVNGTVRALAAAAARGERWDGAIVGEPTCAERIGDRIKIGRRGSQSGRLTVLGRQGHVAYPDLAENPVRAMLHLAGALVELPLDRGTARFQPSNLEITAIETGNPAANVIPGAMQARFNIRFNDLWTAESLRQEIEARLRRAAESFRKRHGREPRYEIGWLEPPAHVFLTHDERLIAGLSAAIRDVAGIEPELSTSGGTSDARFVKDYCPVVEFGLVGQTMHAVDERVALADLELLTAIYERMLQNWLAAAQS